MKILHPRVGDAELYQSFELLGDNGFAGIGKEKGGGVSQERWEGSLNRRGGDGVPETDINLDRKPRVFKISKEGYAHAFIVLILFDPFHIHRGGVKAQAVVLNLQCADFFEDFLEPFEVVFFSREEVRISGWPMSLVGPKLEEQCALQNECIFVRRLAYAVQNPLQRVFGQKKIEVFFFGSGSIEKALLRGCGGVGRNSFAQIRDSIYGRMTLTTRHTLAARHSSSMVAFFSR